MKLQKPFSFYPSALTKIAVFNKISLNAQNLMRYRTCVTLPAIVFLSLASIATQSLAQDTDTVAPTINLQKPAGNEVTISGTTVFSGSLIDTGGSGLDTAFYVIRDLSSGDWVDTSGNIDTDRVLRDTSLNSVSENEAGWQVTTNLPQGQFRLYLSARDNANNTQWWGVRTTISVEATTVDNIEPSANLISPLSDTFDSGTNTQQFIGTASDDGGSGLNNAFYVIRNLQTGEYVSPNGSIESTRVLRDVPLQLSSTNEATWTLNTSLPAGDYRFYLSVRDNNRNTNYWVVRKTFTVTTPDTTGSSIFVASSTDLDDPADFYQTDGYETLDVIRMDVATRTIEGVCNEDDESGCTLADVLADTNGDDDFKVDINVLLTTNDLAVSNEPSNAELRQRGSTSRQAPQKSFRVRLDSKDELWRNEQRIQLNKHPYDQSRMTNKLAFDLMQQIPHLPSLRTQFVNLWIDDGVGPVDQGLYTHVESRAKEYLINRGFDKDDNMYKANFFTFSADDLAAIQVDADGEPIDEDRFEERIEIDRGDDHSKLVEMVAAVNDPNVPFQQVLDRYFNANNVLAWVTVNLLLGHDDSIDQNYFLYNQIGTDTFYFLPWDYDGALRVRQPLVDANTVEALRARLLFGFAASANNEFLRQYYLLPGAHERIKRAADEIRRDYLNDDAIFNLSQQYASLIRPFISTSPDIENIAGIREPENLSIWEERWQSFGAVVDSNLQRLKASPNMPIPHFLKEPFQRGENTVLWWDPAIDITGGQISYSIEISSTPDFLPGSLVLEVSGIADESDRVEFLADRLSLPSGTWYYRVKATSGTGANSVYQVPKNELNENGIRYIGVRKFSVP